MDEMKANTSIQKHFQLLLKDTKGLQDGELGSTPLFTELVRQHASGDSASTESAFTQYGLLGGDVDKLRGITSHSEIPATEDDPRLYYNIKAPFSAFICGSQGSGKSHTLSCLLENCLIQTDANILPRPLTGIVFQFDPFFSETGGKPCEAAYISSHPDVKVRVLCPPTNVAHIKKLYEKLPKVEVQELRLSQNDLNTNRMLDLMAANSVQGGTLPLYLHIVIRILRELRLEQQKTGGSFNYRAFRKAIDAEELTPGQKIPLEQRLDTLESFMAKEDVAESKIIHQGRKNRSKFDPMQLQDTATKWDSGAGQLTIVDLSCPCVTAESACALFNICLTLFLERSSHDVGRVIALDEAHKYMTDGSECQTLTESLLSVIRLQRHLGARVIIATQEPTVSPKLLDLCTVTIVHRFTSPSWLLSLKKHLAAVTPALKPMAQGGSASANGNTDDAFELLDRIVSLRQGQALIFCPGAIIDINKPIEKDSVEGITHSLATHSIDEKEKAKNSDPENSLVHLGQRIIKIRIRERVTKDGGKSVMAA